MDMSGSVFESSESITRDTVPFRDLTVDKDRMFPQQLPVYCSVDCIFS